MIRTRCARGVIRCCRVRHPTGDRTNLEEIAPQWSGTSGPCLSIVTSAPIDRLRTLPIKLLKEYLAAYNITLLGPKEKEDFVQAVVKARNPATGCLSPESEVCDFCHVPWRKSLHSSDK
jgi:hypothetical protein